MFVPKITPYLRRLGAHLQEAKEKNQEEQDRQKSCVDRHRGPVPRCNEGDKVLLKTHLLNQALQGISTKLLLRRDEPYIFKRMVAPTSYGYVGKYHISDLTL